MLIAKLNNEDIHHFHNGYVHILWFNAIKQKKKKKKIQSVHNKDLKLAKSVQKLCWLEIIR